MSTPPRARVVIRGRVQGVGFRWTAAREATRLGLSGWVRNRRDGAVEALAEGEDLEIFIQWCGKGPMTARVEDVEVYPEENGEPLDGFTIRADH